MSMPVNRERPAYRLLRWSWAGLDWIFPPQCAGCSKPGSSLCADCKKLIKYITLPVCERCGQEVEFPGLCGPCRLDPPPYTALRSWAWYDGPVRSAIHRLKYSGDLSMGELFSRPMIQMLRQAHWPIDLVTPVPAGIARQAERGYNQAALLAWPIAYGCSLTYQSKALIKVREIQSQVGLNRLERRQNVVMAYQAIAKYVAGKNVLVIDDVTTSGATLEACTEALLAAGATQVYGLTLARAMFAVKDDHTQTEAQYDSASGNL